MLATVRTDPIQTWLEPKRNGGHRRMAGLSAPDAAAWDALAGRVALALEPRLDPRVVANRARFDSEGWRLADLRPALKRARRRARRLARTARYLIHTDVAAFYPSVTPSTLHARLRRLAPAEGRLAAAMVDGWGSEGYAGLPIGPPGSAVIANAVLVPVDRVLADTSFLRWVDDYLIGAESERAAVEILERLDEALARLGLRRSEAKTSLIEGGQALTWPGLASTAPRR
ncbi:MAG TPA: RNA-directed DNA polymerase [Actinomycetota bacterium]|nr:RNA-directed DNA polymerase [Actinomycetota bacterium]